MVVLLKWSLGQHRLLFYIMSLGGDTRFALSLRLSVHPSVCRRHGFRSVIQYCFGISISNCICMLYVAMDRSLLIFSDVTFTMAAWQPYWIVWFPYSKFWLAFSIRSKLHLCTWEEAYWPIDFQQCHFQTGHLAAMLNCLVFGLCRWHGCWGVTQICFEISISNFIWILSVAMEKNLLIFSDITFKMAAWLSSWVFQFPDSNYSLALKIKSKLQ